MNKWIFYSALVPFLAACGSTLPNTSAETYTKYTYVPVDPLPIDTKPGESCVENAVQLSYITEIELTKALPDQTVRMATRKFNADGSADFTLAKTAVENEQFEVILDYMNTDTAPGDFSVRRYVADLVNYKEGLFNTTYKNVSYKKGDTLQFTTPTPPGVISKYEIHPYIDGKYTGDEWSRISIPIYVGLGLRLKANANVIKGSVNISGFPGIAAKASSGDIQGSLVVQTLGVSGEKIAATLPLPSELNETTFMNSILAMGAIKAQIHSSDTDRTPRVVGFYNPFGGGEEFINAMISALSEKRHPWFRACTAPKVIGG